MADVRHSYVVPGNISIKVRCSLSREVAMDDSVKGLAQRGPALPTLLSHCCGFHTALGALLGKQSSNQSFSARILWIFNILIFKKEQRCVV